jgi:hypothetical protein
MFCSTLHCTALHCRDVDETGMSDRFGWHYGRHLRDDTWCVLMLLCFLLPPLLAITDSRLNRYQEQGVIGTVYWMFVHCVVLCCVVLCCAVCCRVNTHQVGCNLRRRAWNRLLMKRKEDNFEEEEEEEIIRSGRGEAEGRSGEQLGGVMTASDE